ncbi:MAG: type II secretion system F family protein [Halobacteriales archaeon]|nr:type II secretion system F family protein [Halobacteriales archaeon]
MSSPSADISVWERITQGWVPYEPIRRRIRRSDRNFGEFRRSMNQARISTPYDLYLARLVVYSVVAALVGVLVGVFATYMLLTSGFFETVPAFLSGFFGVVFVGTVLSVTFAVLFGVITGGALYAYPSSVADRRAKRINMELPHAIVYMYAMSYGGTNMINIVRSLADEEETYGEVSKELSYIVRDTEHFGSEFHTSIRKLYEITPSQHMKTFLDDLLGVIDSGGDVTIFLEAQGEKYLREAEDEQEESLETLAIVSEMYLSLFLVAPILLIVMLLTIGITGSVTLTPLYVLVYAVLPAGMVAFVALLGYIEESSPSRTGFEKERRKARVDREKDAPEDSLTERYLRRRRIGRMKNAVRHPFAGMRRKPKVTLALTVPLALVWLLYIAYTDTVQVSNVSNSSVEVTAYIAVVPFLIVAVPLALFHDLKKRRQNKITSRFPDKLNSIADANKMGLSFTESLKRTSKTSTGYLAEELKTTYNDVRWNADTDYALTKFARRVEVPEISRTIKLIIEARSATGEIHKVLKIAANDAKARLSLRRHRHLQASQHMSIIVLGFLVYLLIILMLDKAFIQPIGEQVGNVALEGDIDVQASAAVPVEQIPVDEYRMLFFHSVVVQAVGNGLIAGKISDNDLLSGLKYSIGFLIAGTAAFVLFV